VISFFNIPIPPSSNALYSTFVRGGRTRRIPSKEYRDYERAFKIWALQNRYDLIEARKLIQEWNSPLEVTMLVVLKHERVLSKKNTLKRLDVSNRSKALHDKLAEVIGVDDSTFVSTPMEKLIADNGTPEQCIVFIHPVKLRKISEVILPHQTILGRADTV
jgi:hypothetical protein